MTASERVTKLVRKPQSILDVAERLTQAGLFVVPVPYKRKGPIVDDWQDLRLTVPDLPAHFNGQPQNIGSLLGIDGLTDVDLDCPEALALAEFFLPDTGRIYGKTSTPRAHWHYQLDEGIPTKQFKDPLLGQTEKAMLIELRCLTKKKAVGLQSLLPPSVHPSGERLRYAVNGKPAVVTAVELSRAVSTIAAVALLARYWPGEKGGRNECFLALAGAFARAGAPEDLAITIAQGIYTVLWGSAAELNHAASEVQATYEKHAQGDSIVGYTRLAESINPVVLKKCFEWLDVHPGSATPEVGSSGEKHDPVTDFPYTDLGNAQAFVAVHIDTLRWCPPMRKYLVWDGRRWNVDDQLQAERLAARFIRGKFQEAVNGSRNRDLEQHLMRSQSKGSVTSMLELARPELVVMPEELDTHLDLLNFENGTFNLRTGTLQPHDPADFITKLVHHPYDPDATCEKWLEVLFYAMGGKKDAARAKRLVAYLKKVFGLALTGHTTEKAAFFVQGPGDTGKTTVLHSFRRSIEEYAAVLQADTLFSKNENSNTLADLADLRGVRFAMTSEVDEGVRLREGKLKRITQGNGQIKSCRKYENPIAFDETHKLFIDANHRPEIKVGDDATWNRIHLIPFSVRVPKSEQDRELGAKLLAEAPGILAWAAEGASEWYSTGLTQPPEIRAAVQGYRKQEDWIGRFLDERCEVGEWSETGEGVEFKVRSSDLYLSFQEWCTAARELPIPSQTRLGTRLRLKGFSSKNRHGIVYYGLRLLNAGELQERQQEQLEQEKSAYAR